jgi:hypothetical protein
MLYWFVSFFCLITSLRLWFRIPSIKRIFKSENESIAQTLQLIAELQDFKASLEIGKAPESEVWERLMRFQGPWPGLVVDTLQGLRARGASLGPSLDRFTALLKQIVKTYQQSDIQTGPARGQLILSMVLVPLVGLTLALVLPPLQERWQLWLFICLLSFFWAGLGSVALGIEIEKALDAGLELRHRDWPMWLLASGERLISAVRTGETLDASWNQAQRFLGQHSISLSEYWGGFSWSEKKVTHVPLWIGDFRSQLLRAIQVALMEGQPSLDRIHTVVDSFFLEWSTQIQTRVALLQSKALKPLFFFMAPALFSLIIFSIYFLWNDSILF